MTVKSILDAKGREVITIEPEASLHEAARLLGLRRIGAAVVVRADKTILGILSERDIVRVLGEHGAGALEMRVQDAMTSKVSTCREGNTINEVMELMTRGRFRHLPVEKEGRLDGIVSIGDVVKRRIEDVEREAEQIREYIATA
ncbi:CBS domain-containing protein [Aquamicrobium zhengzhouense]|uniref:CBS domain-containing protein n=1 Tax=Aquamicrobium zhengzhouense TaxID=2781738 RepID=A0ABS0SBD2_9HYPH|nr:CBS domain-containing protein [Aquamicrobium zhengzhouense]MBI1620598.1 CBS domain-containing protein [Aquamicrobium zhengzhouense]